MRIRTAYRMRTPGSVSQAEAEGFAVLLPDWPGLNRTGAQQAEIQPGSTYSGRDITEAEASISPLAQRLCHSRLSQDATSEELHVQRRNLRETGEFVSGCVRGRRVSAKPPMWSHP